MQARSIKAWARAGQAIGRGLRLCGNIPVAIVHLAQYPRHLDVVVLGSTVFIAQIPTRILCSVQSHRAMSATALTLGEKRVIWHMKPTPW